jgi:hypothetical protein
LPALSRAFSTTPTTPTSNPDGIHSVNAHVKTYDEDSFTQVLTITGVVSVVLAVGGHFAFNVEEVPAQSRQSKN